MGEPGRSPAETVTTDVVIVGAGIAGAALAAALVNAQAQARAQTPSADPVDAQAPESGPAPTGESAAQPPPAPWRIHLLERESQPGQHSTGRSAAMYMASYGPPQARALTRASRHFYEHPPPGFSDTPILRPRGALYVGWQGQEAMLDAAEHELRSTGTEITRLDAAATLARVPVLRAEGLVGALWEPDAMDIDVHALHQGFLRMARRGGAVVWCDAEVVEGRRGAGSDGAGSGADLASRVGPAPADTEADTHPWTITLRDGRTLRARHLVNAAGAWADELAQRCGSAPVGLQPKRRSAYTFDPPEGLDPAWRDWPVTGAIDETWYFKPDAGQLLASPANADPVPPHDVQPEDLDIATGIAALEADTHLHIRRPRRTWAGLRTFAADGELVIGFDANGLFWLAGQGGYGIQSAWGAGVLAGGVLRGGVVAEGLVAAGVESGLMSPRRLAGLE